MKHFVIILQYVKPMEIIDQHLDSHRSFLDEGYKSGILLASGPQNPRSGGIILGRAETVEQMRNFFLKDPFYIYGCAEYNFIEFIPVKYQSEFKSWFVDI